MKVLLFDVDGTLLLSGGAGLRAMNRAFHDVYGVKDGLKGVNLAGRTDTAIIKEACLKHGKEFEQSTFDQLKETYFEFINDEIKLPVNGKVMMPGIDSLLEELFKKEHVYLGLLTGNWEKSGRIKLEHFGLSHYFSFGAFADDSENRNALLPFAIDRLEAKYKVRPQAGDVYVIGDTPADIQCARPHGAVAVAVATAHYSLEQLREHKPDYLFSDLSDTKDVLAVLT